jgi:alpha-L-arabinofuranosidase
LWIAGRLPARPHGPINTLTLRARKLGGQEGFLILFHWKDDANWTWWNIGGWNNTQHAIELCDQGGKSVLGQPVPGSVATDRWYNLRIELEGPRIRCYLDDQLVHDVRYPEVGIRGAVGVGTWATRASFTNLVVTHGSETLYQSDFRTSLTGWRLVNGQWTTTGGLLRQTSLQTDCRATTGDVQWTNYTLRVRARKDGGQEGFLILFHWQDDQNWTWWNIGGWNNSRHAIEVCRNGVKTTLGPSVAGSVVTGRWYDIRVELEGTRIRCYLDDQLIHDVHYLEPEPLYAVAGLDESGAEVVVKLVNVTGENVPVEVWLNGAARVAPGARYEQLTGPHPLAENSLAQPELVRPVSGELEVRQPRFEKVLPPWSVVVWRIPLAPAGALRLETEPAPYGRLVMPGSEGVALRLNGFPAGPVRIAYSWETLDGRRWAGGELVFDGDQIRGLLTPPTAGLQRLVLEQLEGETVELPQGLLVAGATDTAGSLGLHWWRGERTLWLWWWQTALLQEATDPWGPWTNLAGEPPVVVTLQRPRGYYRLAAP